MNWLALGYHSSAGSPSRSSTKGVQWDEGFRADIVVDHAVIPEIRAVAAILSVHEAQQQT